MVPEAPDQRECKVTDVQRDLGRLEARQDSQDERLERIEAKVDQLTPNFTLRELTRSDVATRMGKSIEPTPAIQNNLARLCLLVLEPIRAELGMPVRVLSGYARSGSTRSSADPQRASTSTAALPTSKSSACRTSAAKIPAFVTGQRVR
jgi:hypothetical protein